MLVLHLEWLMNWRKWLGLHASRLECCSIFTFLCHFQRRPLIFQTYNLKSLDCGMCLWNTQKRDNKQFQFNLKQLFNHRHAHRWSTLSIQSIMYVYYDIAALYTYSHVWKHTFLLRIACHVQLLTYTDVWNAMALILIPFVKPVFIPSKWIRWHLAYGGRKSQDAHTKKRKIQNAYFRHTYIYRINLNTCHSIICLQILLLVVARTFSILHGFKRATNFPYKQSTSKDFCTRFDKPYFFSGLVEWVCSIWDY